MEEFKVSVVSHITAERPSHSVNAAAHSCLDSENPHHLVVWVPWKASGFNNLIAAINIKLPQSPKIIYPAVFCPTGLKHSPHPNLSKKSKSEILLGLQYE